jgi:hypothetical protein
MNISGIGQHLGNATAPRVTSLLVYPWNVPSNGGETVYMGVSRNLSTVNIQNQNNPKYLLGDTIHVRVDVVDISGRLRGHGVDDVSILLRGIHPGTNAAGHVVDHMNGSYTSTFKALWVGSTEIVAVVAGTREGSVLFHMLHEKPGALRSDKGQFTSHDNRRFETVCHPNYTNNTSVCNMTRRNHGLPWYCSVPTKHQSRCSAWNLTFSPSGGGVLFREQELKAFR